MASATFWGIEDKQLFLGPRYSIMIVYLCQSVIMNVDLIENRRSSLVSSAEHRADRVRTISNELDATHDESRRIDDLLHILSLQKAHGGIEIDDKAASILGLDLGVMNQMAEEIEMITDSDKYILLSTAVVLVTLEKLFAIQRQIWEPIIQKSKEWLEEIIKEAILKSREEFNRLG